jgi:hypothetical protein
MTQVHRGASAARTRAVRAGSAPQPHLLAPGSARARTARFLLCWDLRRKQEPNTTRPEAKLEC